MGGDGTIGEAVSALAETPVELGLIPVGTGNDLARSLGIPRNDVKAAVRVLQSGPCRSIDLGWERERRFVVMAAIGYPSLVIDETNRMKRLKGTAAYVASIYKALAKMEVHRITRILDGRETELECTSVLVKTTPYSLIMIAAL